MAIRNALVVDDSKSSRFALRRLLEGFGCNVDTAASVAEAYGLMRDRRPQIMLLDHLMPDINGLDALAELRDDPDFSTVPVVICSSNEGHEFVALAEARGATAVLRKPPTPEEVRTVLEYVNSLNLAATRAAAVAVIPVVEIVEPIAEVEPAGDEIEWQTPATESATETTGSADGELSWAIFQEPIETETTAEPDLKFLEDFHSSTGGMDTFFEPAATPASMAETEDTDLAHDFSTRDDDARGSSHESMYEPPIEPAARRYPEPMVVAAPVAAALRNDGLREEFEARLRRVTQDLFVNIAEIRSQLSNHEAFLEFREPQMAQRIHSIEARVDQLIGDQTAALQTLRGEFDARLRSQEQRLMEAMQITASVGINFDDVRREAREEARQVAEQISAALSERLAQSMLAVLRPG